MAKKYAPVGLVDAIEPYVLPWYLLEERRKRELHQYDCQESFDRITLGRMGYTHIMGIRYTALAAQSCPVATWE